MTVRDDEEPVASRPCQLWPGPSFTKGYGVSWLDGRMRRVHVWAWEQEHGLVPEGKELHHRCGHRACYEVAHLVALTPAEHKAAHFAGRTHCNEGHEYTPENTIVITNGNGKRQCRTCYNARRRERYASVIRAQ